MEMTKSLLTQFLMTLAEWPYNSCLHTMFACFQYSLVFGVLSWLSEAQIRTDLSSDVVTIIPFCRSQDIENITPCNKNKIPLLDLINIVHINKLHLLFQIILCVK